MTGRSRSPRWSSTCSTCRRIPSCKRRRSAASHRSRSTTTTASTSRSIRPAARPSARSSIPGNIASRLTQPKLVILGTNDRYWPLDACNLYWNDLQGEKYLIYVPNNGHGLPDRARLIAGLNALNRSVITGKPLPKLEWGFTNGDGTCKLKVASDMRPSRVAALDRDGARPWTSATRSGRRSDAGAADATFRHQVAACRATGYAAYLRRGRLSRRHATISSR